MTISLIWAQAANGVLGRAGTLPWRVPEDLTRFRELTMGATVVMGRRTWESLPPRWRPLPGRRNVVLTRDPTYDAPGAQVVTSLDAALSADVDVWVAGGGEVYAAALPLATRLAVTDVDVEVDGDTFAPAVGPDWRELARDPHDGGWHTSSTGLHYRWRELTRAGPALADVGGSA